jgi:hypothetical protein
MTENQREKLLKRLDDAWDDLCDSYSGLSDPQLLMPGVTGSWSVRDIIAHVTTWEEEALKHLPTVLQGGRPPRYSVKYGGIAAFNALMTTRKAGSGLSEVIRQQESTHRQLLDFIQGVPEEHLGSGTRFCRRLRQDTYGHYLKHAQAIRKWRSSLTIAD